MLDVSPSRCLRFPRDAALRLQLSLLDHSSHAEAAMWGGPGFCFVVPRHAERGRSQSTDAEARQSHGACRCSSTAFKRTEHAFPWRCPGTPTHGQRWRPSRHSEILPGPMSQENVEIIRALYERFNREGIDAVTELAEPNIEFVPPPIWPDSPTLYGTEAIVEMASNWIETFDGFRIDAERFIDPGGDGVAVFVRDRGRIHGTDTEINNAFIHVWTLRDGKIVRWQSFTDQVQALEAAGLEEWPRDGVRVGRST
jgi:hypothetical protein